MVAYPTNKKVGRGPSYPLPNPYRLLHRLNAISIVKVFSIKPKRNTKNAEGLSY